MPLTEADRIKMLEELAQDQGLKATQRLRAIEELGRIDARRAAAGVVKVEPEDELPPDPMADLELMERDRQKRARKHVGTLIRRVA